MSPLQYGKVDMGTVVTLTVSSGLGDINTVSVYVDLPSNAPESVSMTVIMTVCSIQAIPKFLFPNTQNLYA